MPANRHKSLPEFNVKTPTIRNRKKKEKMEGYNDLKPQHQPYSREHRDWLLDNDPADYVWDDEDDYRGYVNDDD